MGWLSKVGHMGFEGLKVAMPLLTGMADGYVRDPLHTIAGAVLAAEATDAVVQGHGGDAMDKLAQVVPIATGLLMQSPLLKDKQIADPTAFADHVSGLVDSIVGILNAVEEKQAAPSAAQPPAPKA